MARRWYIVCDADNTLFLDVDVSRQQGKVKGCLVIVSKFHQGASVQWEIDEAHNAIKSAHSGLVIDIGSREGVKGGNDMITWTPKGAGNQRFEYDPTSKTITCPSHGLVLEPRSLAPDAGVMATVPDNAPNQKWRIFSVDQPIVNYRPPTAQAAPAPAPAPGPVPVAVPQPYPYPAPYPQPYPWPYPQPYAPPYPWAQAPYPMPYPPGPVQFVAAGPPPPGQGPPGPLYPWNPTGLPPQPQ
jgi:hypothetical protein